MCESLTSCVAQFVDDEAAFERSLRSPVLLYESHEHGGEQGQSERRLQTQSIVTKPTLGGGESMVLRVRKEKDNAFRRGITLGRTSNNDVVLDDPSVSRFHAWFQVDESGEWAIVDAGSKNGTYLAGVRLKPKRPSAVHGDVHIRFGQVQVTFLPVKAFLKLLQAHASR